MDIHFDKPSLAFIRDGFSEEPCNILYDQTLDNKQFVTATGFVPSMRIKKYKPAKPEQYGLTDGSTMCYIDRDADNSKIDVLFKNDSLSCKKTDTIFGSDFITDVFEDNKPDRSQNFPFNKCVFKIDDSKVNIDKLNTFWEKMGKAECDALFADLRKENKSLEADIAKLLADYTELVDKFKKAQIDSNGKNVTIKDMSSERDELLEKKQFITINLNNLKSDYDKTKKKLEQTEEDYKKVVNDYNLKVRTTFDNQKKLDDSYAILKTSFDDLKRSYKQLQQEYSVLKTAYDTLYDQYQTLKTQNNTLKANLQNKEDEYKTKKGAYDLCQYQLNQCLQSTQTGVNDLKYRIIDCKTDIKRKTIERDNLQKEKADWDAKLIQARSEEQKSKSAYESCNQERIQKTSLTKELQDIIDKWKIERNYCGDYDNHIQSLTSQIGSVVSWCQIYTDLDKYYIDLARADIEKLEKKVDDSCKPATPKQFSITDYYKQSLVFQMGGGHQRKTAMIGTFQNPVSSNLRWKILQRFFMSTSGYQGTFQGGSSWKGLIPVFSDEKKTGSAENTTYMVVSPMFWVSKSVTAKCNCVADDEAFIYINGTLVGKTNNDGVRMDMSYNFKPYMPYVIVVIHINGGDAGELIVDNGFDEVIDAMIEVPSDVVNKLKAENATIMLNSF